MGVNLIGLGEIRDGEPSFNWYYWRTCLEIASTFGWQPAGTVAPTDYYGDWNGTYFSNDLQEVAHGDARALGMALHRAITAVEIGQALTEEQARALDGIDLNALLALADFSVAGKFAIG